MIELMGPICGVTFERQLALHLRETFRDQLTVAEDIGSPIELHIDDRKPDARDRSYPADTRHAVHLGFDREADELLDFRRGVAFGFRHDGNGRTVEVRKHIDGQLARGIGAQKNENARHRKNKKAIAERGADQECEHERASSAYVIEKVRALRHDPLAGSEAGHDQHTIAVERLRAHAPCHEPLGGRVLVDKILTV